MSPPTHVRSYQPHFYSLPPLPPAFHAAARPLFFLFLPPLGSRCSSSCSASCAFLPLFLPSFSAPPPTASSRLRPPCTHRRASPHYRNNGMVCLVLVPAIVQLSVFYLLSSLAAVIDRSGIPFNYRVHCSHQSPASRAWPFPPLFRLRLQWSLCFPRTPPMSAPCPNRQARSADLRPLQSPTLATVTWGPSLRPSHAGSSAAPPRTSAALSSS